MKKINFKWLLLSFILSIASFNDAWGKLILIDMSSAPNWYDKAHIHYYSGGSDHYEAISSTGILNIYKATIPDSHGDGWRLCRYDNGRYNECPWISDSGSDYKKYVYNASSASTIVGLVEGGKLYFDNSKTKWTGTIQFVIGHSSYSRTYTMTKKAGTELCYLNLDGETYKQWADATYFAVISTASKVDDGGWGSGDLSTKAPSYRTAIYSGPYSLDANSQYLITTSSGAATGATITIDYKSAYTAMNYAQTVTLCTKAYGAGSYSANTSSLTSLNFTTYKLDGIGSVTTQQTSNMNGSTGVASGDACQAAITTINVGDAPASWVYDGIYPAMNSGSQVSDDQEFTYYPTAATNYYVRFHEVHDPSVGLAASSSYLTTTSGLRALTGEAITLTATATYTAGSPVYYTYEYSTNGGSTWNSIASNVTNTSKTFTPETTGDYKFRVTLPSEKGTPSAVTNVHVTEMYTIKVKKNASWTPNKLYIWNASSEIKQYGAFPGETGHFTNNGQWYEFDLNSDFDSFIISASDHNSNHTTDVNSVTSDGCYAIGGTTGTSCSVSSDDCPTAPTVTLTTTIRQNQITLKGQITDYGNDGSSASDMEEVGFYVGATKHTAVCDDGGYFYKTVTGLTANTQYSIYAFATNAGGTGVSATATPTTLATTAKHKLKVQVPNSVVPYIYTYCDNDACGSNSLQNADFPGQAATRIIDGVSNDWYEFDIHDQYDKFIISAGSSGEKQTANISNTRADICRWYNNSPENQEDRYGTTDCPVTETSLYVGDKNAAAASHTYYTMSGTTTMSKTVSLAANHAYEFKIVYNAEYYGIASKTINRDGKTNNVINAGTSSAGAAYIYFNTDFAGDYTITFNESTKAITVTYPTAYVVTYSKSIVGTDNSTTAAPSAAYTIGATAVTSGDLVPNGTGVTFTAAEAGSGYTWKGWYTVENPSADYSANRVATTAEYAPTISAATTIYAVYAEDMHTVTVTAGEHGSITTPAGGSGSTVQAGIATNATIEAAAVYGYYFRNWTVEDGNATFTNASSASTTVNATSDATIKANFVSHWSIAGGDSEDADEEDALGNWNLYVNGIESFVQEDEKWIGHVDIILPANTTFYFKVRDLYDGSAWYGNTGIMTYGNHTDWLMTTGSSNCRITTAGAGTYTFTWNETDHTLTVAYPTSYTVTYGKVADNGQDIGSVTVAGDDDDDLASGEYVAKGSATFTAAAAENYTFVDWRTSDTYGEGTQLSTENPYTMTSIAENKTVYAHYVENMTTVTLAHTGNGSIKIGEDVVTSTTAGVVTTRSITAVPDAGYYFSGWTVEPAEGADYSVSGTEEANTTITLRGRGAGETTGQTLTANFVELDKIYFRNENEETGGKLWDVTKMYVYYNVGWANDGEFAGVNNLGTNAEMNPISAESNIYWAYVPRSFTTSGNRNVAFSDKWMGTEDYPGGTYTKFHNDNAVYRTDYNKNLNMYVPEHTEKYTSNSTKYFDNGYWMKYNTVTNQDAGYYLKEGNKDNQVDIFKATGNNATTLIARYRFENTSNHTFFIANAAGQFYKASAAITNAACTNVTIEEDAATPVGFTITPTSEGYYTLYIEQSGEKMKLSVVYPISAGDYRLDYTYDTDKHLYSDVFKPDDASSTNVKKSVYIDPETTGGSLKLQKCSGLDGSANPIWTSGRDIALSNFKDGKGVYEFDMTITDGNAVDADVTSVALSNVKIYDGPFYIKTDYAPGGWVNYKENVLEQNTINFSKSDANTFDYYHCAWVGEGDMNVKCIIANDYNEQITDTLKTDAIVTGTPEVLPATANVRFSYNSVTNTLKRTYLNGSANWQDRYLLLAGDVKIRSIKTQAAYADNDTTMVDNNNWTYVLDLEAQGGAKVRLSANYNNTTQWLIGDATHTVQILGGTDTDWASLRIVYDFKTNHLLSAWLVPASGTTPAKTLNTSVMVLRENQNDAHEITFASESHALSAVDTVYSALHFTYDYLTNQGGAAKTVHERTFYWISFPYDVKVSDIFGSVGNYMEEWGILYYDGKQRAKNGMWIDSPSCWKYMAADDTLHAFEGYVAEIDLALIGTERNKGRWINNVTDLCLYFPSNGKVNSIVSKDTTISIDQTDYLCNIDRTGNNGPDFNKNRTIADSYWHCLGVPSFAKKTHSTSTGWTGTYPTLTNWETQHVPYVYVYDGTTNSYNVVSTETYEFKPMRSYLTQFNATSLTWSSVTAPATPSSVAARRAPQGAETDTEFRLTLMQDAQEVDRTFVRLCDDENVTAGFEFNYDLCKEMKTGANVYTIVSNYLPVAGNCLPMNNQTTIVPVGVKITANGEYTFAMPDGTNGTGVTLIDNETGDRTNLSLFDYSVNLTKGDYANRFILEISPIQQMPTNIDNVQGESAQSAKARKVMIDGILYIVKDGKVFDAQGKRLQ